MHWWGPWAAWAARAASGGRFGETEELTLRIALGEALGQLYVAVAFPPDSKAKMEHLVGNLRESLKQRLSQLDWMGEETRAKAEGLLRALR